MAKTEIYLRHIKNFDYELEFRFDTGGFKKIQLKKCTDHKSLSNKIDLHLNNKNKSEEIADTVYFRTVDLFLNEINSWQF